MTCVTYQQRPVCRRGGCGRPASDARAEHEADLGFCDTHRQQNEQLRHRLTLTPAGRINPETYHRRSDR